MVCCCKILYIYVYISSWIKGKKINRNCHSGIMMGHCAPKYICSLKSLFQQNYIHTVYIWEKKTLYLIKMITAFSFFKLSYPEGQLGWVLSLPPMQLQLPSLSLSPFSISLSLSLFVSPSLCLSPSLHCGSVNCSYSNIPSLPSPQLSFSQPLSCGIINLLVLSTCKSQTIEPYGAVWGAPLFIL